MAKACDCTCVKDVLCHLRTRVPCSLPKKKIKRAMPIANNSLNPKCEVSADFPLRISREMTGKKTGAGKTTYPEGGRGASECLALCAPGFFNVSGGAGECTACEKGKYNQTAGATVCQACPLGHSTIAAGASTCSKLCAAGSYGAAGLQVIPPRTLPNKSIRFPQLS